MVCAAHDSGVRGGRATGAITGCMNVVRVADEWNWAFSGFFLYVGIAKI